MNKESFAYQQAFQLNVPPFQSSKAHCVKKTTRMLKVQVSKEQKPAY